MAISEEAPKDSYRKNYKIRRAIPERNSVEVTFPWDVVEREARRHNITVDEFLTKFWAVAQYDSFEGVFYKIEPIKE